MMHKYSYTIQTACTDVYLNTFLLCSVCVLLKRGLGDLVINYFVKKKGKGEGGEGGKLLSLKKCGDMPRKIMSHFNLNPN